MLHNNLRPLLFLLLSALFLLPANGFAAEQASLTVLPFSTPVNEKYTHLQDGLASMLASRVAGRADLVVINPGDLLAEVRKTLKNGQATISPNQLQTSKADYIIIGSLIPADGQFRLNAQVFHAQQPARHFSTTASQEDQLFQEIDKLAWDISGEVFGIKRPAASAATQPTSPEAMQGFATPHPERVFRENMLTGSGATASIDAFLLAARRSRSLSQEIRAMDAGDLDGDGQEEIILASGQDLHIYSFSGEHFAEKATVPIASFARIHAVNIADITGDKKPEIIISANNDNQPVSFIIRWDGKGSVVLAQSIPWYLRPVQIPGQGIVLMGQQAAVDGPLASTVQQVSLLDNGTVQKQETVPLPAGVNLFDFAYADLDENGRFETIAISAGNQLVVFNEKGERLWEGGANYGVSAYFFGKPPSTAGYSGERAYIPQRIAVQDLDQDGKADVVVARNTRTTISHMNSFSSVEAGSIEALTWHDNQLQPLWTTRSVPGAIAGLQMIASPRDAGPNTSRLYFGENTGGGAFNFFSDYTSMIHTYTLKNAVK